MARSGASRWINLTGRLPVINSAEPVWAFLDEYPSVSYYLVFNQSLWVVKGVNLREPNSKGRA
jgi:hypothetical protein